MYGVLVKSNKIETRKGVTISMKQASGFLNGRQIEMMFHLVNQNL